MSRPTALQYIQYRNTNSVWGGREALSHHRAFETEMNENGIFFIADKWMDERCVD